METFSALLAICAGNSPATGEFPAQRPVTRSFDVFFDLRPNKRLSKRWRGWYFETPSCPLRRHCNVGNHNETQQTADRYFMGCTVSCCIHWIPRNLLARNLHTTYLCDNFQVRPQCLLAKPKWSLVPTGNILYPLGMPSNTPARVSTQIS